MEARRCSYWTAWPHLPKGDQSMSILNEIATYKRDWVRACRQRCSEGGMLRRASERHPLGFASVLSARIEARRTAVIAEVKKASPSKGVIRPDFDPEAIATSYADHGACCLSVLTDERFFQGADAYLSSIREAVDVPILRKDFMLDPYQVIEARAIGADAILIILAMVDDGLAEELCAAAREQGLAVLPEVHDRQELERALALDTSLLGINNRDLHSFETSLDTTLSLLSHVGDDKVVITESGIYQRSDVMRMQDAGVYGFLVGESLMRQPDPGIALADLIIS